MSDLALIRRRTERALSHLTYPNGSFRVVRRSHGAGWTLDLELKVTCPDTVGDGDTNVITRWELPLWVRFDPSYANILGWVSKVVAHFAIHEAFEQLRTDAGRAVFNPHTTVGRYSVDETTTLWPSDRKDYLPKEVARRASLRRRLLAEVRQ